MADGLAFVTGADGLLGANLVRALLGAGHRVRALIQSSSTARTLEGLDIEVVRGDLLDEDPARLDRALAGCDCVFHCAAITDPRAPDALVWRVNLDGTKRVVDASVRARVRRFVQTASASVFQFGPASRPGTEEGAFSPAYRGVAYVESKAAASAYVEERVERGELDAVLVAPTFMLGPFDARPSSGELIRQYVARRMFAVPPGGRNFVHVGDVAGAMVNALTEGRAGETYLVGGENMHYYDFFRLVAEAVGVSPPRGVLPKNIVMMGGHLGSAAGAVTRRRLAVNRQMAQISCVDAFYDSTKAVRELRISPTPIRRAIHESVACLREYGHIKGKDHRGAL